MVCEHSSDMHLQLHSMDKLLFTLLLCLSLASGRQCTDDRRKREANSPEYGGYSGTENQSFGNRDFGSVSVEHHYFRKEPKVQQSTKLIPVHQTIKIPVLQKVMQPIHIPVPVRMLEPYPIKIPVPVVMEKIVHVPVEKIVKYEVEKPVPVKVVKKVPVPVPKPYPVPVPVYKTKYVYHTKKYHH